MARLHLDVMRTVLDEIVDGRYAPGQMLPKEQDLAKGWDVSRGVAREVIRALEERGVVTVRHGRGATVSPDRDWNVLDRHVVLALVRGPGRWSVLSELLECRAVLEIEAARLAAERATDAHMAELELALGHMDAPRSSGDARGAAEVDFHRALVDATRNRPLVQMLRPLLDAMNAIAGTLGRRQSSVGEHQRIADAVAARDAEGAARAMRDHLDGVRESVAGRRIRAGRR